MTVGEIAQMTLVRPFVLCVMEPIVLCFNLYIALVYGILYIFISSFQVVFVEGHGFNLGENGLAFLVRPVCPCLRHGELDKLFTGTLRGRVLDLRGVRTLCGICPQAQIQERGRKSVFRNYTPGQTLINDIQTSYRSSAFLLLWSGQSSSQ